MSLVDNTLNVTHPNAINGKDTTEAERLALVIEEFTGDVEGTIQRRSVLESFIPVRTVKGTATFTNHAVGKSTLQKVTPGVPLDGVKSDFAKRSVTVDTVIAAREFFPLLEVFQTQMDTRKEVAQEQGKEIAKFFDQALLIQAIKSARLTQSAYSGGTAGKPAGHGTGNLQTLATADRADPDKLYAAIKGALLKMELQDVDPREDGCIIVVSPQDYHTLIDAEKLINMNYVTSAGNKVNDGWLLKAIGVPVLASNNLPQSVITGHHLTTDMNNFDGDFSKTVASIFSPKAIMAGATIPVESDVYYEKLYKSWVVDSHLAFAVGPNRVEFAAEVAVV